MQDQIKDLKRNMILDIAEKHFLQYGYEATQISTLASELNIAVGTIYNLFKSKEHLFTCYLSRKITETTNHFKWEMEEEVDPSKKIRRYIFALFKVIKDNEELVKTQMLLNPIYFKQIREMIEDPGKPVREAIEQALQELSTQTELISDDLVQLSYLVATFPDAYVKRWLDEGTDFSNKVDEAYELLMHLLIKNKNT